MDYILEGMICVIRKNVNNFIIKRAHKRCQDYYWSNHNGYKESEEKFFDLYNRKRLILDVCILKINKYCVNIEIGLNSLFRIESAIDFLCEYIFKSDRKVQLIFTYIVSRDFLGRYIFRQSGFRCGVIKRSAIRIQEKEYNLEVYVRYR